MWGIFFGEFQCLLVNDCPAASCDSGVLTRGSESTSFYSAILVQAPKHIILVTMFALMFGDLKKTKCYLRLLPEMCSNLVEWQKLKTRNLKL